jgi:hypothetical protein
MKHIACKNSDFLMNSFSDGHRILWIRATDFNESHVCTWGYFRPSVKNTVSTAEF